MPSFHRFVSSFNRANLRYEVRKKTATVTDDIANVIRTKFPAKSGIVYCFSQKDSDTVAAALKKKGIKVTRRPGVVTRY